jgi:hypothetical protein
MLEQIKFWLRIRWVKYLDDREFRRAKHVVSRQVHNMTGHYDHNGKYHA